MLPTVCVCVFPNPYPLLATNINQNLKTSHSFCPRFLLGTARLIENFTRARLATKCPSGKELSGRVQAFRTSTSCSSKTWSEEMSTFGIVYRCDSSAAFASVKVNLANALCLMGYSNSKQMIRFGGLHSFSMLVSAFRSSCNIAFPVLWNWDLNAARAFLTGLYCPVAACWSSSQPPSFPRGIHGESVPRDLVDSQLAAGAQPCDPGAKHREVVEMQPGRSALLPCGDEWFGFSVVSKIDRYPIQESWMQIWSRPALTVKDFLTVLWIIANGNPHLSHPSANVKLAFVPARTISPAFAHNS